MIITRNKNKYYGFTLIELIIFIVITGIVAFTILSGFNTVARYMPASYQQATATQAATQCLEWFLGQRYIKGFNNVNCSTTTTGFSNFCTPPSNGYTISATCTGDSNYNTVTVKVTGLGTASLSLLIANY